MSYYNFKPHRIGTDAHIKELSRAIREYDLISYKMANGQESKEDVERLKEIVDSGYACPKCILDYGFYLIETSDNLEDVNKGYQYLQKAKKVGNEEVCLMLAIFYLSKNDKNEMISCLKRAKWHGSKEAAMILKKIEGNAKHSFDA